MTNDSGLDDARNQQRHPRPAWLLAAFMPVAFGLADIELWIWAGAVMFGALLAMIWRGKSATAHWSSVLPWISLGVLAHGVGTNALAAPASGSVMRPLGKAALTVGIGCALVLFPVPAGLHDVGTWLVIVALVCWLLRRRGKAA